MIIPKKLQVVTEKEILEEVAKETGFSMREVNDTFDAWLYHLDDIVNNTSQCTVMIPKLGTFYASMVKMKRSIHTERQKKFKAIKEKEIEKLGYLCGRNLHRFNVPVILAHGISKKNRMPWFLKKDPTSRYYSPSEVVNNQVNYFFDEDIEFAGREDLREYFLRDEDTETDQDNKSEITED